MTSIAGVEVTLEHFVGGDFRGGGEGSISVVDPTTGSVIAEVPKAGPIELDAAVTAATDAFPGWAATSPGERAFALLALADAVEAQAEVLGRLESRNVGKPVSAIPEELAFAVDNLRFFAGGARLLEGRAAGEYLSGYTSMLRRDPVGVVAAITPWNYPLMMAVWKLGPALAAGCTAVLKPSELTPFTTLKLAEMAAEIFPPGVVNVVIGDGTTGAVLVNHPGIDMISLTGSVPTGKKIAEAASRSLKRVHLELGGKAPVVVFDDADLEAVTAGVRLAGYVNAGQDCTAAARVITGPRVHDDVVDALAEAAASLTVGDPEDEDTELGPLVSERQRQRVTGFVERALAGGARVATGGKPATDPGGSTSPRSWWKWTRRAEIVQQEVFGPVVTVQRAADEDEAIAMANGVEYGLAAASGRATSAGPCGRLRRCVRDGLGQRPLSRCLRDATRRLQAVGIRQGPLGLRHRGLHRAQARDGQVVNAETQVTSGSKEDER